MNNQFYEIEARQRIQSSLNEANNARLLRKNPYQTWTLRDALQNHWTSLRHLVRSLPLNHSSSTQILFPAKVVAK